MRLASVSLLLSIGLLSVFAVVYLRPSPSNVAVVPDAYLTSKVANSVSGVDDAVSELEPIPILPDEAQSARAQPFPQASSPEIGTKLLVSVVDGQGMAITNGQIFVKFSSARPVENDPAMGRIQTAIRGPVTDVLLPSEAQYAVVVAAQPGKPPSQISLNQLRIPNGLPVSGEQLLLYEVDIVVDGVFRPADVTGTIFVDGAPRTPRGIKIIAPGPTLYQGIVAAESCTYYLIGMRTPPDAVWVTSDETTPLYVRLPKKSANGIQQDLHCKSGALVSVYLTRRGATAGELANIPITAECSTPTERTPKSTMYRSYVLVEPTDIDGVSRFRGFPMEGSVTIVVPNSQYVARTVRRHLSIEDIAKRGWSVTISLDESNELVKIGGKTPTWNSLALSDLSPPLVVRVLAATDGGASRPQTAQTNRDEWFFETTANAKCQIWAEQNSKRVSTVVELVASSNKNDVILAPLIRKRVELSWTGAARGTNLAISFVDGVSLDRAPTVLSGIEQNGRQVLDAVPDTTMQVAIHSAGGVGFRAFSVNKDPDQLVEIKLTAVEFNCTINGAPANGKLQLFAVGGATGSCGALADLAGGASASAVAIPEGRYVYRMVLPEFEGLLLGLCEVNAEAHQRVAIGWIGELVLLAQLCPNTPSPPSAIVVTGCDGQDLTSLLAASRSIILSESEGAEPSSWWFDRDSYEYYCR
ncbi:MAG: hypothetical protein IPK67_07320 [Planctomycetes bacterium]|nr:hypothetical protein [Planctomycetota bacterium]